MCFSTRPLTLLLSFSLLAPLYAADPLVAVMPEKSSLFFNFSNLTKLREAKDHPLVKGLAEGELGKALQPLMKKFASDADADTNAVLKEETGLTLEELLAKFPGAAAGSIGIPLSTFTENSASGGPEANIVLAADFTGDEALMAKIVKALDKFDEKASAASKGKAAGIKAALEAATGDEEDEEKDAAEEKEKADPEKPEAKWPEDYEETVTDVGGFKVHEWTVTDPDKKDGETQSWSVAAGKALISVGKADLKEIVARLAKPSDAGSLAASAAWKTIPDTAQQSDILMGVNLESLLGDTQEMLRLKMEKGEMNTGGLPINPLQAWVGAGLDQFRAAFVATTLETEDAAMHYGLTYAEKPAIIKIYAAKGPGTPPAFVPADVQELSWGTMDWGAFYDNITQLATAVSPMAAGGIEMGTNELKKKIGVDLRKDILGQMGDGLWSTSHRELPAAKPSGKGTGAASKEDTDDAEKTTSPFDAFTKGQSQVMGIALRDAKAFSLSLNSIFNTLAPGEAFFEDRDFMGTTIHQIKALQDTMPVAWLIHQDTMILSIGKSDLLEKILGGMAKPPTRPLMEEPHVKSALAKLPDGGVSSGYADAGHLIDAMLSLFKTTMGTAISDVVEEKDGKEVSEVVNSIPDRLNLPWHLVTRLYLDERSTDIRIRLSAKP